VRSHISGHQEQTKPGPNRPELTLAAGHVPYEVSIADDGSLVLPLGLLAQAGMDAGSTAVALSLSDGRITLRRLGDAAEDLLRGRRPN
jgi:hypothetical protein